MLPAPTSLPVPLTFSLCPFPFPFPFSLPLFPLYLVQLIYLSFPHTFSLSMIIRNQQGIYTYLSNRADLLVRECVKKYYDCWLVCDDRACNRRTMQQASAGAYLVMTSRQLNITFPSFLSVIYSILRFYSSLLFFVLSLLHSFFSACLVARIFSLTIKSVQGITKSRHSITSSDPLPCLHSFHLFFSLFISFLLFSSLFFPFLLFSSFFVSFLHLSPISFLSFRLQVHG